MANIFKLNQVVSKNKYNKGIAATQRFDVVDLGQSLGLMIGSSFINSVDARIRWLPQML